MISVRSWTLLTILLLGSCSTYLAVSGLRELLPGIADVMVAVGICIEVAKYSTVAYLRQNWEDITWYVRAPLVTIVLLLLMSTSAGVFGYLGKGYQSGEQKFSGTAASLAANVEAIRIAQTRLEAIDAQIARLPDNSVQGRLRLSKSFEAERRTLAETLTAQRAQQTANTAILAEAKAHTGPLVYVAEILSVPLNTVALALIGILTLALDPLSLMLTTLVTPRKKRDALSDTVLYSDAQASDVDVHDKATLSDVAQHEELDRQTPDTDATSLVPSREYKYTMTARDADGREASVDHAGKFNLIRETAEHPLTPPADVPEVGGTVWTPGMPQPKPAVVDGNLTVSGTVERKPVEGEHAIMNLDRSGDTLPGNIPLATPPAAEPNGNGIAPPNIELNPAKQ